MGLDHELVTGVVKNASLSNYKTMQAIIWIYDISRGEGLFSGSLAAAVMQTSADAGEGLKAFLENEGQCSGRGWQRPKS